MEYGLLLKSFFLRLGHVGILIGLSGASVAYSFNVLAGHPEDWVGPAFAFLMVFCVYNFDHLRDAGKHDLSSAPVRAHFMHTHRRLFAALIGGCALLYCLWALAWRPAFLAVGVFYLLSGALYVVPVAPGARFARLKDIPYLKNAYVPACWLILVLYSKADILNPGMWGFLAIAHFFLRLFVGVIVGDVRDCEGDRLAGVKTLATALGRRNSFHLIQALNLVSIGLIIVACLARFWNPYCLIALLPVLYSMRLAGRMEENPGEAEFLAEINDLEYMSYGPLLLLATVGPAAF